MALTKREFVNGSKPPIDADFLNELQDAVIDLEENGGGGSGTGAVEITESDYENLTEEEKNADVLYMISDKAKIYYKGKEYSGVPSSAENIAYDNTESGFSATNVQSAIDELAQDFIIEQNLSSSGGYRKWNSGLVELWGTARQTGLTFPTALVTNSLYYSNLITIPLPIRIMSVKSVTASATNSGLCFASRMSADANNVYVYVIQGGASARDTDISWNVMGTWK